MGQIDALEGKVVHHAISEAFLRYQQARAFTKFDLVARQQGREYRYAYAGGHPENIGNPGKRLFKSGTLRPAGRGYELDTETMEDYENAWSPTLLEDTDYVYRDRMEEALGPRTVERINAPSSLGKNFYAVARENDKVIYRPYFIKKVGGKDFEGEMSDRLKEAEVEAISRVETGVEGALNAGDKAAVTRAANTRFGVSGSTGFAKGVLSGYSSSRQKARGMLERFMKNEMYRVVRDARSV